jgi:hypothetical protein
MDSRNKGAKMKLPVEILKQFEDTIGDRKFGEYTLTLKLHDGAARFVIGSEISVIPEKQSSGGGVKNG